MTEKLLGSTELAHAMLPLVPRDHPAVQGRFSRRVAAMLADGLVETQRIRGRWYVREDVIPEAARILGLVPYNSYANENPPTGANG